MERRDFLLGKTQRPPTPIRICRVAQPFAADAAEVCAFDAISRFAHTYRPVVPLYRDLRNAHLPTGNDPSRLPVKFDSNPRYCDVEQDRCRSCPFRCGHGCIHRVGAAGGPAGCCARRRACCCVGQHCCRLEWCALRDRSAKAFRALSFTPASAICADAVFPASAELPLLV